MRLDSHCLSDHIMIQDINRVPLPGTLRIHGLLDGLSNFLSRLFNEAPKHHI